ncbi:MAG: enoyl-CoA hydratase [Alphaproteobacteria bacterium]|nr:enoyl-CoA hydratase [Alphaproteobacteria bacterium]
MLEIERLDEVAVVTLNRPEAMNALSRALRAALDSAITELSGDDAIRVLILTGAGRAFTAGLDLKELGSDPQGLGAANAVSARENPVLAIAKCPKPVIAAVNGVAITGGFELALACDVILASSLARFADTHARVGILPGWGLSQKLSRLIGPYRAKELSLSGNFLDAPTALDWGLVNRVTSPEALMPTALALARDMAGIPTETLVAYKRLIDDGYAMAFGAALDHEHAVSSAANRKVTPQMVEARRAAIQARGRTQ